MFDSEAKRNWMKQNTIQATIKINRNQDADMIEYYGGKVTATDIRTALREYMQRHPKEKKEEK